jgi:hypothetical protein
MDPTAPTDSAVAKPSALSSLGTAIRAHTAAQVSYAGNNLDLLLWCGIPVTAFVLLQPDFLALLFPGEHRQADVGSLVLRTLLFVVVLYASLNLLKRACQRQVVRDTRRL